MSVKSIATLHPEQMGDNHYAAYIGRDGKPARQQITRVEYKLLVEIRGEVKK